MRKLGDIVERLPSFATRFAKCPGCTEPMSCPSAIRVATDPVAAMIGSIDGMPALIEGEIRTIEEAQTPQPIVGGTFSVVPQQGSH